MPDQASCVKEVRRAGAHVVVVLRGAIDLHHAPDVHRALITACDQRPPRLIVNLAEVSYMDSSGIGTLVEVFRRVNGYKGVLALCGMNERVHSVFEITKLDKLFKVYSTEDEALAE